ncbi:hypothetical protein MRX96_025689 [Rhipicephalus microplus]
MDSSNKTHNEFPTTAAGADTTTTAAGGNEAPKEAQVAGWQAPASVSHRRGRKRSLVDKDTAHRQADKEYNV